MILNKNKFSIDKEQLVGVVKYTDGTINKNSLGEMDPEAATNYLRHIIRTSKYFFSMNHEHFRNTFSDGKKSLVNSEYNLDKKWP